MADDPREKFKKLLFNVSHLTTLGCVFDSNALRLTGSQTKKSQENMACAQLLSENEPIDL